MCLCDLTMPIVSFSGPEMILLGSSTEFKENPYTGTWNQIITQRTEMMQKQNSYFT